MGIGRGATDGKRMRNHRGRRLWGHQRATDMPRQTSKAWPNQGLRFGAHQCSRRTTTGWPCLPALRCRLSHRKSGVGRLRSPKPTIGLPVKAGSRPALMAHNRLRSAGSKSLQSRMTEELGGCPFKHAQAKSASPGRDRHPRIMFENSRPSINGRHTAPREEKGLMGKDEPRQLNINPRQRRNDRQDLAI